MLSGLVGLTAIASSDSFRCRWLISTLAGVAAAGGPDRAAARAAGAAASAAPVTTATTTLENRKRYIAVPSSPYYGTLTAYLALLAGMDAGRSPSAEQQILVHCPRIWGASRSSPANA